MFVAIAFDDAFDICICYHGTLRDCVRALMHPWAEPTEEIFSVVEEAEKKYTQDSYGQTLHMEDLPFVVLRLLKNQWHRVEICRTTSIQA